MSCKYSNCTELKSVQFNAINCEANKYNDEPYFIDGCDNLTNFTFGESVQRIPKGLFNKIIVLLQLQFRHLLLPLNKKRL